MFSISQSEYKAMIDVCMGGRVAETLSELFSLLTTSSLTVPRHQFTVKAASRAGARQIFKRRLTRQPKWSRWGFSHV